MRTSQENERFLAKYNTKDMKAAASANPMEAIAETQSNPRLQDVAKVYGSGIVSNWLTLMLTHTFMLCGFDANAGQKETINYVADSIARDYEFLRMNEIALFLVDFEHGRLGEFGTRFQSQKFFLALQAWQKRRGELEQMAAQKERERQRVEAAKRTNTGEGIPHYCKNLLEVLESYHQHHPAENRHRMSEIPLNSNFSIFVGSCTNEQTKCQIKA